jgi:putative oxidoreductase
MTNPIRPPSLSARASAGLLLLRLVAGAAFVFHGSGKIGNPFGWAGPDSGFPAALQALAALSEFGGGIAWILGALTPLASFGIACTMAVAIHLHAFVRGDPFVATRMGQGSFEPAAVFLAVAALLLLAGPGCFSLDRLVFGERGGRRRRGTAHSRE